MTAPVCRCGHSTRSHAFESGRCHGASGRHYPLGVCDCRAFDAAPVALPRGTSDRCVRCGTTHATTEALPWCPVEGRKGAADA